MYGLTSRHVWFFFGKENNSSRRVILKIKLELNNLNSILSRSAVTPVFPNVYTYMHTSKYIHIYITHIYTIGSGIHEYKHTHTHIFGNTIPSRVTICRSALAKEPDPSAKEPYTWSKEPYISAKALYLRKRAPYLRARVCASQYAETLTTRSIPLHLETSLQKSPVSPQKSPVSPQKSPVSPQKSTIYPQKRPMSPQKCPSLCEGALTTRCIPLHLNSTKKHRRKRTCCAF